MATIEKFEDIRAWKEARQFCSLIYEFIQREQFKKDFRLREQINGSSGSIMDNIAEGFERGGNKEFINFLRYSKGSGGEARSQLYRAFDRKYITKEEFANASVMVQRINGRIQRLIEYLMNSDFKGPNYKQDKIFEL